MPNAHTRARGLYNLVERPDDAFQATYFGGDEDDYFSGKHKGGTIQGEPAAYENFASNAGSWNFAALTAALDVPNYVDQAMLAAYAAIGDYPQYYYGLRLLPTAGRVRFFVWDAEDSWGGGLILTLAPTLTLTLSLTLALALALASTLTLTLILILTPTLTRWERAHGAGALGKAADQR